MPQKGASRAVTRPIVSETVKAVSCCLLSQSAWRTPAWVRMPSVATLRDKWIHSRGFFSHPWARKEIDYLDLCMSGAEPGVAVKALRYNSEGLGIDPRWCRWGFFSEATDWTVCPGVIQPLKMSTRKTPGGEGGRCVRVTTLLPSQCRMSRRSRSLNLLEPQEPHQSCSGNPLPLCTSGSRRKFLCFTVKSSAAIQQNLI
jgi:hypothetical protein